MSYVSRPIALAGFLLLLGGPATASPARREGPPPQDCSIPPLGESIEADGSIRLSVDVPRSCMGDGSGFDAIETSMRRGSSFVAQRRFPCTTIVPEEGATAEISCVVATGAAAAAWRPALRTYQLRLRGHVVAGSALPPGWRTPRELSEGEVTRPRGKRDPR